MEVITKDNEVTDRNMVQVKDARGGKNGNNKTVL